MKIFKDFLSCKHYSELCSKKEDADLSFLESAQHTFHHIICYTCRRFSKQLGTIQSALSKIFTSEVVDARLSDEAKSKIKNTLKDHSSQ